MHLERLFNMPSGSHDLEKWLEDPLQTQKAEQSIEAGNVRYERALTYFKGTSQDPDHESGTQSAFQAGMPGILPVADLEKAIDIGKWRLRLQNVLVRLEVSQSRRSRSSVWQTLNVTTGSSRLGRI